jgi:hypothetical protein
VATVADVAVVTVADVAVVTVVTVVVMDAGKAEEVQRIVWRFLPTPTLPLAGEGWQRRISLRLLQLSTDTDLRLHERKTE